jgi:hypothetical protein
MSTLKVSTISPLGTDSTKTITIGSASNGDVAAGVFTNTPAFKAKASSNQAVTESADNKVVLGTEVFDTDNAFDNSTNYRFTVPSSKAGKYLLCAGIGNTQELDDGSRFNLKFYKNGSEIFDGYTLLRGSGANQDVAITTTAILDLSVGDYIELYFYTNNSDTNVEIKGDARTFMSGHRLVGA